MDAEVLGLLLHLMFTSVFACGFSGAWSPEDNSSICRRGEEGPVMGVPPTLDHFVPVLPCHCLRQWLCKVTWTREMKKNNKTGSHCNQSESLESNYTITTTNTTTLLQMMDIWNSLCTECILYSGATLQVTDDDLVVIGTSQKMMGTRWEAHWANVTAVGAVRLDYTPSSDVVQHAGTVLLTSGQQAATGIHCHWSNSTSCVRQRAVTSGLHLKTSCVIFIFA